MKTHSKSKNNMKSSALIVLISSLLLLAAGCGPAPSSPGPLSAADAGLGDSIYAYYVPVKIDIIPLTEFIHTGGEQGTKQIKLYVSLLDEFDCQKKAPAIFRFELYERVMRSAEPRGRRIAIWPDIDLTDPARNNEYWQDFLRAYVFNLDFEPQGGQNYVLQVTYIGPNGERLTTDFTLEHTE